ncbi:hypothetical protein LCGC14_1072680 [marine sediment metagenome]|uniref:Toprim domain-containing protein n=1 Tax=marine sediment metagenome TaxID=412755 RepID=A0A0F9Q0W1_9ZZZZ
MDIERVAEALGLDKMKIKHDELEACCPLHDDTHPSFSINLETGLWFCQSRCGGGNIIQLVARVKGIKTAAAKNWLKDLGVASAFRIGAGGRLKKAREKTAAKDKPKQRPCPPYDITAVPMWVLHRGFTTEILKAYQCGYSRFYGALVIPVLQSHALIYRFNPGRPGPKYKSTDGFKAHRTLFGLGNVTLGLDGSLILVEGPLDVLWLRQHGYGNSLAIFGGGTLGLEQRRIIKDELRPKKLILAFDNDEGGASAAAKSVAALGNRIPCYVVQWDKMDFTDEDDDELTMLPDDVADLAPENIKLLLATAVLVEPKKRAKKSA